MKRFKLYYFSTKSLSFVEARWFKTRFAALSMVLGMVVLAIAFETNLLYDDVLGLGFQRTRALAAENAILRDQLKFFSGRLQILQGRISTLVDQGNEVRLLVDLPKLDKDTREAGYGGTDDRLDFGLSGDISGMLNDLRRSVTKAEKEVELQQRSYRETAVKHDQNQALYASLPAIKPMEGFYSISGFGMRLHPIFRRMLPHEGLDIANDVGTPVYATGDGVVVSAGRTEAGLGIMAVIDHGFGYTTVYGHLDRVLVRSGERVKRGALIARSGRTGIATGPHLHYEVRLNGVLQNPVDHFFDDIDYQKIKQQLAFSK